MTSVFLIDDPDPERRRRTAREGARLFSQQDGRGPGTFERASVTVMWGGGDHVPVSHHVEATRDTLLLGDVLSGSGPHRITASNYGSDPRADAPPSHDGLHVAITVSDGEGWLVAADLLGILPVYYWVAGNVRLVASSPGLLRAFEGFDDALDEVGLTGLLLIGTLVEGRTLVRRMRRLSAGHALRASTGAEPREVQHYRVPITAQHHGVPLEECSHRMHEALVAACDRHVEEGVPHALLLSGGHDSRLLAGILARLGRSISAVTRGEASDNDYRCARRVARHLGFEHRLAADSGGTWEGFRRSIQWHGMATSPGSGTGGAPAALGGHTRSVSGYLMDAVLGGTNNWWCYSERKRACGFDQYFGKLNQHAVGVDLLRGLLRPEVFGSSVDDVLETVRERYRSEGDTEAERTWRFALRHRQRFQLGSMLVRQAEAVWPRAPHLDREVLATAGGIPFGLLGGRLVERDMLVRFHRGLARLPLDRGSDEPAPIESDFRGLLRDLPGMVARRVARKLHLPSTDRRYYERQFSLESAAWQAIRRGAEAARPAAHALFNPAAYDALIPQVGEPWPAGFRRVDTLGRRLLLGTAAWAATGG